MNTDNLPIKEEARQYSESQMPEGWDRKDAIQIAVFYNHMVDYLAEEIRKKNVWLKYEDWKEWNYEYDDYDRTFCKKKDGQIVPFSGGLAEMDLRKKYIKDNRL